jgi:hypothetical protein
MSTREDFRQFAQECLRLAEKETDAAQRQTLLEMADAWTLIALKAPLFIERPSRSG